MPTTRSYAGRVSLRSARELGLVTSMLPKPKVRISGVCWLVDFGGGQTAIIRRDVATGDYLWRSELGAGVRASLDEAFISAWWAATNPPPPVPCPRERVEAAAVEAETGNVAAAVKNLRWLLRARAGAGWSVRRGRGREQFCVRVSSPPRRLVRGAMPAADRVLLSAIFGFRVGRDGVLIEDGPGRRRQAVLRAAGLA